MSRRIGVGLWSCRTARTLESSHAWPVCRQSTLGGCALPRPLRCASRRCRAAFGQLLYCRGRGEGRARVPLSSRDRVGQAALTGRGERPGASRGLCIREGGGRRGGRRAARTVGARLEQEGWRGDAARASVRWLDGLLRPAAPSVLRGPGLSARLSRTQPHSAALCCTLLHSAALCCYLPPSVILGHSRAQSAVLMNTLRCRTKAPSDCTDSATLSHIECQVGRAHLGVGVRGRVWPSVAVPRLALFTLCYSQARSAALGYTLSGYAAICPPRQLGRVQLS